MLSVDSMLTKVIMLSSISNKELVMTALEYCGSSGNLLISKPISVISPSSLRASRRKSSLRALKIASFYGFSIY